MRLFIITVVILFPNTCSYLWSRLPAVTSSGDALAYLCALRASRMSEIPSPASSSSDGEEVLSFEEILEEASLDAQEAANSCSCGEHKQMMGVFDAIEGGRVVAAAAGIVKALRSCRCDKAREFLQDALQVVAQLGSSPGEEKQLLHLWTVVFESAGQEQSPAALAVCTSDVPSSAPSSQPSDVPSSKLSSQPSTLAAGGWDRVDAEVDAAGMQAQARILAHSDYQIR